MKTPTQTQDTVNVIVRLMMAQRHETQTSIAKAIGMSQPQVGFRLRPSTDEEHIDWRTSELDRLADHWKMPVNLFLSDAATAYRWLAENQSDPETLSSSWNSVEQLDLFSPTPQTADVTRRGEPIWEFSGRTSAATSTNGSDAANGATQRLVA